jgi:D-lactate dehydrogenase
MKKEAIIINTARGAIVNTQDLIEHLKNKTIGGYGMDVYENEKDIFFHNHSKSKINDSLLNDLMKMNNVIITPHQAFATYEALLKITEITFDNIKSWYLKEKMKNEIYIINRSKSLSENLIS